MIIPSYNRETLLRDTLDNVLGQTRPPDEVIVVDDGSIDHSRDMVAKLFPSVTLLCQENLGPGAARNKGFKESVGDLIWFMDSDDLVTRNKLEEQATVLENSTADFAYSPWIRCKINEKALLFKGPVLQAEPLPDDRSMLEWHLGSWSIVFQNCLFKRATLEKNGGYRTDLYCGEDNELLVRILLSGAQPVHTANCSTFYRSNGPEQAQLTVSGRTPKDRAEDTSCYLDTVTELLAPQWQDLHRVARKEFQLSCWRHHRYCARMGFKGLNTSTRHQLGIEKEVAALRLRELKERVLRKMSSTPSDVPLSKGLATQPVGEREQKWAAEIGYISGV